MKRFRSLIALALSLALVVVSPGSSAYHAAAQTMGASAARSSASGAPGAAGAIVGRDSGAASIPVLAPSNLSLSPVLSAPSVGVPASVQAVGVVGAAASPIAALLGAAAAPSALKAFKPAAAKAVPGSNPVVSVKAAIQALKTRLPTPSGESKPTELETVEARELFDGGASRAGVGAPVAPGSALMAGLSGLSAAAKGEGLSSRKDSGATMPDGGDVLDGAGNVIPSRGDIDELGNPRRGGGEGGPDDRSDPDFGGDSGNSGLFGLFGVGLLGGGAAAVAGLAFGTIAIFPMVILSLVLHEIGHARMADKLGDPTARLQNRASFNPRHWLTHIDPVWTLLIPAVTFLSFGAILGGARPVPVEPRYFKNPTKDMAIVALAGPAVNMGLAVAGALAFAGATAAGLGAGVLGMLFTFVFLNALLAIFNLLPVPPLDGGHIFLSQQARAAVSRLGMLPIVLVFLFAGNFIVPAAMAIAQFLVGGVLAVSGVQLASAFLPVLAALGLALGQTGAGKSAAVASSAGPANAAVPSGAVAPVDLIVMFGEKATKLRDSHIANVDVNLPDGVERYTRLQQAMLAQLETAGLDTAALEPYKATPLATYARINAATIKVDGASVAAFTKDMSERGFAVHANSVRRIVRPVMADENRKLVKADVVQAIAEKQWGKPELGFWRGLWAKVFKSAPVQPKFAVIAGEADASRPMTPWSRNTTYYKAFLNDSATLDAVLKSLTQAGNDGSLVISNPGDDSESDPSSPDVQLVKKLASEGHIMVSAGGNDGLRKNTTGGPVVSSASMAPDVAGAIALLAMMFGVTEVGPKLDAVVDAMMSTLEKTGKSSADEEGEGFLNVDAAYKKLRAVPSDVEVYRMHKMKLSLYLQAIERGNWTKEFIPVIAEFIAHHKLILKAMESADKTLAYRAAGPVKRLFLKATGAAPGR